MMQLPEFKSWFDAQFAVLLDQYIEQFISLSSTESVQDIARYIREIASGGKRFRPYMVYIGYTAQGGKGDIFPVLAAIEILHLFALVHDDVMDEAKMRHGVATTHTKFGKLYSNARLGESLAILEGDLLMAWSYKLMRSIKNDAASKEFEILVSEVIHGQMMDTLFTKLEMQSAECIVEKMTLKTARYSFYRPLMIGMLLGENGESQRPFAEAFATNLGVGFQIQDDLLDIHYDPATGKPCCGDIKTAQQTLISWYMLNRSSDEQQNRFKDYYGNTALTTENETELQLLLEESGALEFAKLEAERYFDKAGDAIGEYKKEESIWHTIVVLVASRTT